FDFGFGRRRRRIVGEADHDLDRLTAAVGQLAVKAKLDPAKPAASQVAHRLDPKLIEVALLFPKAPTPGFVEAEEHAAAGADKLLQDERLSGLCGAVGLASGVSYDPGSQGVHALRSPVDGGATRMDRQDFRRRLGPKSFRPPENLLQAIPDVGVLALIRTEAHDGMEAAHGRDLGSIAFHEIG